MGKRVKLPGRVESAEIGGIVTGAGEILDDLKGKTQEVINTETDAELLRLDQTKQVNLTFDQTPTENSTNPVTSGGVYAADQLLSQAIEAILLLIPSAASALNKLVDMNTMNSSISTATASFKGTYNLVSDLHLGVDATHAQIEAALDALSLNADNNDYAFVQVPNSGLTPTEIKKTERYKFNGIGWKYEYDLNNSGFTETQWAAINSNITAVLVSKLSALPTNEALTALLAAKQDVLTFDDSPTSGSNNPVKSGGIYTRNNEIIAMITALDAEKQDVLTFDTTPTENSTNPVTSNGVYQAIYLVQAALAALDGRMLIAEHSIEVLTDDVGVLRTLYQALSQSDIIVGGLPVTGVANTVYRVPGTSTYADWMYYDGAWVKLAEYTTLDGYLYKGIATPSSSPAASADKMFYFALTAGTYTNFGNIIVTEGISILKYDGANWSQDKISYMDGGVFDVTAYSGSSFASLDALLSDANLNNLIPSAVRKGGMSIKFVHTPDNKYVQCRLKTNAFSLNTNDWSFCEDIVLVDNPEFIKAYINSSNRLLWAIKSDGTIYYGAGVPQQVIDYVQEKIDELGLDEYEDIVNFLDGLEDGDKTLQQLLNEKVDKVQGRSLIDADVAEGLHYVDNPEFQAALINKYNRILFGIHSNGNFLFGAGVPYQIIEYVSDVAGYYLENEEWQRAILDSNGRVIVGIRTNGEFYFGAGVPKQIKDYFNNNLSFDDAYLTTTVGTGIGKFKYGDGSKKNTLVGYENLIRLTTNEDVHDNTAIGYHSLCTGRTAAMNTAVGSESLDRVGGERNVAVGYYTGASCNDNDSMFYSTIEDMTAIGCQALRYARGNRNSALGAKALYGLHVGNNNLGIGFMAGAYVDWEQIVDAQHPYNPDYQYDTVQNAFYLDNLDRGSKENMNSNSMMVGEFANEIANQWLKINGKFAINGATPQGKASVSADATDLASAIALLNELKNVLKNFGLIN